MKRVLVALLAISMAAGVLTGCGSKGSEKTFTVGFDAEFPPYGYRDGKDHQRLIHISYRLRSTPDLISWKPI